MSPMRVGIVAHTHWDREWHIPFETARLRLADVVEQVVAALEADPAFSHYLLDGQTAPIDDAIELRPDLESRLGDLITAGRIAVGPWTVLPDEFLVSGETLVRNLQSGLARAAELGSPNSGVGYLPDSFGHIAQMPQLLRQVGIDTAVMWRGVPLEIDRVGFSWRALDGSEVRGEHLYGSYANGRALPRDPRALVDRIRSYGLELGSRATDEMLLMNGGDQRSIEAWLPGVVERTNREQDEFRFEITSLADYLAGTERDGLPTWSGELRSGAHANLLPGVVSNRVDLRRAAAAAEHAVEGRAERLSAMSPIGHPDDARALKHAWRLLILNSAHDSVCGCVSDEVADEVMVRYRRARQVGDELADRTLAQVAAAAGGEPGSIVVANCSDHRRDGLVEVEIEHGHAPRLRRADGSAAPVQFLGAVVPDPFVAVVQGQKLAWVLQVMDDQTVAGAPITQVAVSESDDESTHVILREAADGESPMNLSGLRAQLKDLAITDRVVHFRVDRKPRHRVLIGCGSVPSLGWSTMTLASSTDATPPATSSGHSVNATDTTLSNGLVTVAIGPDATWSIATPDGLAARGLGRIVDGGDGGDTYNWSPPADDTIVDRPARIDRRVTESGPLRGRIELSCEYQMPLAVHGDEISTRHRDIDTAAVLITTILELRVGEPLLRVSTEIDNRVRDHRLRVHLPLPCRAETTQAGCAFGVVERGLLGEGGPHEAAIATFPARGFVDAGDGSVGLAVLTDAASEYELVEDGTELSLTLLRATGYLSRVTPEMRPNPAGPALPVEHAQVQGLVRRDYAVLLHRGNWEDAGLVRWADHYQRPLETHRMEMSPGIHPTRSNAHLAAEHSQLQVDGALLTSLHRDGDMLVARVVRMAHEPGSVKVTRNGRPARGTRVDLIGRPSGDFEAALTLGPFEIATLRLAPTD